MATKLYVGNLAFQTTSQELQELFAQAGTVKSASAPEDRITLDSRSVTFVESKPATARRALLVGHISEVKGATFIEEKDVDQKAQPYFAGIKQSRKRARKLQTEINRLKKKSQAIIEKLT